MPQLSPTFPPGDTLREESWHRCHDMADLWLHSWLSKYAPKIARVQLSYTGACFPLCPCLQLDTQSLISCRWLAGSIH